MTKVFLAALLSIFFNTLKSQIVERICLNGPLEFNKTEFNLVWSQKPQDNYYVQEYIPKNETVDRFNELITVNVFLVNNTVQNAVQQKIENLNKRKETDKLCNYNIIESPDGKEFILDCLLSLEKDNKLNTVEFIIYRYKQIELENHKKALLIYSYSKRSYDEHIPEFLKHLAVEKTDLLNVMISKDLPEIKINEKI
ncbi:hypothetical protein [Epilithonimonas sp.]|uniref:hypothetical protein n=1 Tax=Epilithonimonas sp. TaxID=2894511 RepID=UPI0035AEEEA1